MSSHPGASRTADATEQAQDRGRATDRIVLQGMEFYAYHGVHDEEGRLGARFAVDVELYLPLPHIDSIRETVDYGRVYALVQEVVTGSRFKLIEALATTICTQLLDTEPLARQVVVRVHKPNAPLPGVVRDVFVEVARSRQ